MIAAKTSRATTGSATKAGLEWKGLNKSSNGNGGGGKMFDEARIAKLRSKWISLTRGTEGGTPVWSTLFQHSYARVAKKCFAPSDFLCVPIPLTFGRFNLETRNKLDQQNLSQISVDHVCSIRQKTKRLSHFSSFFFFEIITRSDKSGGAFRNINADFYSFKKKIDADFYGEAKRDRCNFNFIGGANNTLA